MTRGGIRFARTPPFGWRRAASPAPAASLKKAFSEISFSF